MQIFRISSGHDESARFPDNRRLSKQVPGLYQIIRVNRAHGLIEVFLFLKLFCYSSA